MQLNLIIVLNQYINNIFDNTFGFKAITHKD